ncbi:proteasome subunit beta type-4 [Dermacentor variabilis]|uniref:proteasome subunit beta type-4 n=1 Tax=Dermacentor variabilis TaxID=34621 RepID=UPI003F5C306B
MAEMAFNISVLPGETSFGFSKFQPTAPAAMHEGTRQRTQSPMTTATSVLGIKFDGGVMLAADILGSYGSLARFRNCPRILKVNDQIAAAASGDYADFQYLKSVIDQKMISEQCLNDGFRLKPKSLYSWLTRVMYNRRSRFDPLWNTYLIAGLQDGVPFLGQVDMLGTAFESSTLATGYGAYIAQPLLREAYEKKAGQLTKEEAQKVLTYCLRVLYYRDARSFDKYQVATVTAEGVVIEGPLKIDSNWEIAHLVKGYE